MERLDGSVRRALRRAGVPDAGALAEVTRAWPGAVGERIARSAWPQRLARDGLVVIMPRRGIMVSEINLRLQLRLLEVRRELERLMARLAAERATPDERREKLIADYKARFANPYTAAERGYIDDVIIPRETRWKLVTALETLQTKRVAQPRRKHGNIPL